MEYLLLILFVLFAHFQNTEHVLCADVRIRLLFVLAQTIALDRHYAEMEVIDYFMESLVIRMNLHKVA